MKKNFKKTVIIIISAIILPILRMYWFVFRVKTLGVEIIISCKDEILFVKTTYGKFWSFPGGGVKNGESERRAIEREIFEELGLKIFNPIRIGEFISTREYKIDNIIVFAKELDRKEQSFNDNFEIDVVKWFPINNLPKLGPVAQKIIEMYKYNTYE